MTDSITVEIPPGVLGNSPHTVRVVSNGVRAEEGGVSAADHLSECRRTYPFLGYTMTEREVTGDGSRSVITEFWKHGKVVWQFRTDYYTRVDCARCVYRWAEAYVVIEQDGVSTDPEPLCVDHVGMTRERVRRARDAGIDLTMHQSQPLRIGQH